MIPYRIQHALNKLAKRAAEARGMLHIDTHDLRGTLLLAGSGRSGTTWLSQIINPENACRDIFEPFHPHHIAALQGWPAMRYLPATQGDCAAASLVRSLLAGRVRSRWTDAYNRKHLAKYRLVKAIRVNLMLGWVRRHCPEVKLLFAMRHPCAVAHSRVKLGWNTHLDQLLAQPALMRDHLEPYRQTIERAAASNDPWQRHLTMWCIENLVPLRELDAGDAHVLRYEDFCRFFDRQVIDLYRFLDRPVPTMIHRVQHQRSAHYRRDSAILRGGDLVSDWQRHVSPRQIDCMLDHLQCFGLSHLYDERAMPRCSRDDVFINRHSPHGLVLPQQEAA